MCDLKMAVIWVLLSMLLVPSSVLAQQTVDFNNDGWCGLVVAEEEEYKDDDCDRITFELIPKKAQPHQAIYLRLTGVETGQIAAQQPSVAMWSKDSQTKIGLSINAVSISGVKLNEKQYHDFFLGAFPAGEYSVSVGFRNYLCEYSGCFGAQPGAYASRTLKPITVNIEFPETKRSYDWVQTGANSSREAYRFDYHYRRSANEYNGFWYDPEESGRGFNIQNSLMNDLLVAAWYDYAADGSPTWFMLDEGKWVDDNKYEAKVFEHVGSGYDQALQHQSRAEVGVAQFHFTSPYKATFEATVYDKTISKSLVKLFPK